MWPKRRLRQFIIWRGKCSSRMVPSDTPPSPRSFATEKNPLLHIGDLYDTALCLRVLWILHYSHVQFFLAFAECDVCCAITRGDLKYVQKLAVRRYLQNLTAEPLGNINVTFAVDLHAIRSNPPRFDLVSCEKV